MQWYHFFSLYDKKISSSKNYESPLALCGVKNGLALKKEGILIWNGTSIKSRRQNAPTCLLHLRKHEDEYKVPLCIED